MATTVSSPPQLTLVAVAGPQAISLPLDPEKRYTVGRRSTHAIALMHPEVSKDHAALDFQGRGGKPSEWALNAQTAILSTQSSAGSAWIITDLGSRHGTRINGVPLDVNRACPVMPGDLIEIAPWTFCLMDQSRTGTNGSRVSTMDDSSSAGSTVASIQTEAGRELAQERLRLLLRCAEALQRAADEREMAEIVLEAAIAGTGYANAAVTRPMTPDGAIELIVARGEIGAENESARLSRSLLRAAGQGLPVQMMGSSGGIATGTPGQTTGLMRQAVSIAEFGIDEAICVPLMVESTVAGFLYLDSRARRQGADKVAGREACAYAVGIGRLASMAWSNLMRLDLEKRYARMEGELAAAAEAQAAILPPREGRFGELTYVGECRPGRVVSGDFFDVIPLSGDRVAVMVGDVSGKGIGASVLMTIAVGLLNGALRRRDGGGDPAVAVAELNRYLFDRNAGGRFLTLWLGVFDINNRALTYIDAGHGYAMLTNADGTVQLLDEGGGSAVGTNMGGCYEPASVRMEPGGCALIVSDGIIEQPAPAPGRSSATPAERARGEEFGKQRLEQYARSLCSARNSAANTADEVAELFRNVIAHAKTDQLADDATVVAVRW